MHHKTHKNPRLPEHTHRVRLQLVTTLIDQGDGRYRSLASKIYDGKNYVEQGIVEFLPAEPGYPAPGAVVVQAVCSREQYEQIDDAESGNVYEHEEPGEIVIYEGSVFDDETGIQLDPAVT